MPTTQADIPREFQMDGASGRLLTGLRGLERQPDLAALGRLVVEACLDGTDLPAATLVINPETAGLLDPGWTGRRVRRLRGCAGQNPTWDHAPREWEAPVDDSSFTWGQGAISGHEIFANDAWAAGWIRLQVLAAGQVALVLTVELPAPPAEQPARVRDLQRVGKILQLVGDLWQEMARLEADLQRAGNENQTLNRLNRLQSRLVGMAAHEIKTPLTSITAYADALGGMLETDVNGPAPEFVDVIRTEAGRLLRMVNRILDFSRLDSGLRMLGGEPTDLRELVEQTRVTLRPIMAAKRIRFAVESADPVPRAVVEADLIRQVLVNLIGNAVKFTPDEGSVTVTVVEAPATVEVRIADTGPGIPARDIHRIFREFYRSRETATRQEGTGLGLTIVRHIINLHEGTVEARQRMGGGSIFTFRVPKEIQVLGPLPAACTLKVEESEARRLVAGILQLVAEMTDSCSVLLWLGEKESSLPVAGLGTTETAGTGPCLEVPWGCGTPDAGHLQVSRPRGRDCYRPEDEIQVQVLARVAAAALANLSRPTPDTGEVSGMAEVRRTIEALRALLQIRRGGIPTADAEALHLLNELGRSLDLPEDGLADLLVAAALHDAGMARVEDEILLGQSSLSFDERDEVDRHVEQGVDLMRPLLPSERCAETIRQHHERVDGSGYPDGLQGEEIVLGARLLAVVDAWFSLTRGRPFRNGLSEAEAWQEIEDNAGSQFDPEVVAAFAQILKNREAVATASHSPRPASSGN